MLKKGKENKAINLALFDFDGTLYRRDSFTGFIFYALPRLHILRKGVKIIPWVQAYFLKLYPADKMRQKLFKSMFNMQPAKELQTLAHQYAQTLTPYFNQKMLKQLKKHQDHGDKVVLVSASIDLYLKPVCDELGIELICTEVEVKNNDITGNYTTPDCSAEQKKLRILEQYDLDNFLNVYAYGNSYEDLAMLSLADYPFMVGVDQELPHVLCKTQSIDTQACSCHC